MVGGTIREKVLSLDEATGLEVLQKGREGLARGNKGSGMKIFRGGYKVREEEERVLHEW